MLTIVQLKHMLIRTIVTISTFVASSGAATLADTTGDARAQAEFGIEVAQKGLWQEAIHRWERACSARRVTHTKRHLSSILVTT